jgi:hypothetical protein
MILLVFIGMSNFISHITGQNGSEWLWEHSAENTSSYNTERNRGGWRKLNNHVSVICILHHLLL